MAQFLFQARYFVENYSPVGFNLGFARAPHADAAALAFEVGPHSCEPWKQILILREFHLRACCGSLRTFCEYVENQACAVKNLHFQLALDVCHLLRREIVVENHEAYFVFFNICLYFLKFPFPDISARVGIFQFLYEPFLRFSPCGACKEIEFVEIFLHFRLALSECDKPYEHSTLVSLFVYNIVFNHCQGFEMWSQA